MVEQTIDLPVIWDAMKPILLHFDARQYKKSSCIESLLLCRNKVSNKTAHLIDPIVLEWRGGLSGAAVRSYCLCGTRESGLYTSV